jgi:N-acetylmuramoyl-L-alanine amidase
VAGRHRQEGRKPAVVAAALVGGAAIIALAVVLIRTLGGGASPGPEASGTAPGTHPAPSRHASPAPSTEPGTPSPTASIAAERPQIVWRPIPFPASRREETAAYARRHYGIDSWRLERPRVIVEHYTAGTSFQSAWNTFASDQPDPGLGELPGTCAHFIIDTDGTIYQLVKLNVMCRHTVGLNWVAFGIEHVGTSDQQVLHDRLQLEASLRLTLWLMSRFHIGLRDVIGHNESLTSPFHREAYPAWRCQTHADWTHADMETYRARLAHEAKRQRVRLEPGHRPVRSDC